MRGIVLSLYSVETKLCSMHFQYKLFQNSCPCVSNQYINAFHEYSVCAELSLSYTEYKLNSLPRILSISVKAFHTYSA